MKRRTRLAAAILAIVAMFFAPFAMALHACHSAQMEGMAHASMPGGELAGDDAVLPLPLDQVLCERHCHPAKLSFQPAGNPPSWLQIPFVAPLRVQAPEPVSLAAPAFDSPFAPAAGPAPPLIGFTVLRI